jgi:DNA (cytosine-5)-methyltransferase 1
LNGVAGALQASPGMKQQTFVAAPASARIEAQIGDPNEGSACSRAAPVGANCLTPWDTQQARISAPEGVAPTMVGADNKGGTNQIPSILCLNDQGGGRMDVSEGKSGALRAQMDGHPPLVFENHGIDSRYTGPHPVAPTLSARGGTGGNNLPLALEEPDAYCVAGNAVGRRPENGGNGLGCQSGVSYALTRTDRHAVFSRQRADVFDIIDSEFNSPPIMSKSPADRTVSARKARFTRPETGGNTPDGVLNQDGVASTQSARQHKDATDLVADAPASGQPASGGHGEDHDAPRVGSKDCEARLIRRLTVLECERLQGYPDYWTDVPGASDSARYRALGNSVAIPCVEFVMRGIAYFLRKFADDRYSNDPDDGADWSGCPGLCASPLVVEQKT